MIHDKELIEKIESRLFFDPNTGCHLWMWATDTGGYGQIAYKNKLYRIHRTVFEYYKGEIKSKNVIMHSCDTRRCCNIFHLKSGTQKENVHDAVKKKRMKNPHTNKRFCNNGHEFTEENTKWVNEKHRKCRKCIKINNDLHNGKRKRKTNRINDPSLP